MSAIRRPGMGVPRGRLAIYAQSIINALQKNYQLDVPGLRIYVYQHSQANLLETWLPYFREIPPFRSSPTKGVQ
jgi:hypothetical protein